MKTKLFSFLLVLLAVLCAVSCARNIPGNTDTTVLPDEPNNTTSADGQTTTSSLTDIVISENKTCNFKIVRGDKSAEYETDAATLLYEKLARLTSGAVEYTTDWIKSEETHDAEAYEILVGHTNYNESAEVFATLPYGAYKAVFVGNKLVVAAHDGDGLNKAVSILITKLTQSEENGKITLATDYLSQGSMNQTISSLPLYKTAPSFIIEAGTNHATVVSDAYQLNFIKTDETAYNEYCEKLKADGYSLTAENKIGVNTYRIFASEKYCVTAYYLGYISTTRVIIEPKREMAQLNVTEYAQSYDTTLMQLGLDFTGAGSMNAYIVQLADGSFVLADCGTEDVCDKLIKYMTEKKPATDEKIHIRAIFISHWHPDHINGFWKMADYKAKVQVDAVYVSNGAASNQTTYVDSSFMNRMQKTLNAAAALGGKVYTARTGQHIELCNAKFDIMWTPEDYGTTIITDYNNACMVVRMISEGQTIMFMGDCRDKSSPIVVNMYKQELKSDIVTVAHHGYGGSVYSLYTYASPTVLLWPNTYYPVEIAVSKKLLDLECVKEHILASDGQRILTLPYTPAK